MTIGQQYALLFLLRDSFSALNVFCCTLKPTSLEEAYKQLRAELLTYVDDLNNKVFDGNDLDNQKANLIMMFDSTTFFFIDHEDKIRHAVGLGNYTSGNCPGKKGGGQIIAALSPVNIQSVDARPVRKS